MAAGKLKEHTKFFVNYENRKSQFFSSVYFKFSTSFEPHYRAYILDDHASSSDNILHSNLFTQTPVHIRKSNIPELKNSFILLPFTLCTE